MEYHVKDITTHKFTTLERVYTVNADSEEEAMELVRNGSSVSCTEPVIIDEGVEKASNMSIVKDN